jgi:hypothetical protein
MRPTPGATNDVEGTGHAPLRIVTWGFGRDRLDPKLCQCRPPGHPSQFVCLSYLLSRHAQGLETLFDHAVELMKRSLDTGPFEFDRETCSAIADSLGDACSKSKFAFWLLQGSRVLFPQSATAEGLDCGHFEN